MSRKEGLLLAIIFFITVMTWIILSVYRTTSQSSITPIQQEEIKTLSPSFDINTIHIIEQRTNQ